jgi:hypothetical protein
MFENRKWVIISKDDVSSVDFSQVLETSANTLRYNKDGTKTFVKFEGDTPLFLSGKTLLSYAEILEEIQKDEWQREIIE